MILLGINTVRGKELNSSLGLNLLPESGKKNRGSSRTPRLLCNFNVLSKIC
jgi:hypothetical protein